VEEVPPMTTAWILSGGASFGAIQVGIAVALAERVPPPDLIVGTSIGAVNAAMLAADPSLTGAERLRRVWVEGRRRDVLRMRPGRLIAGLVGRSNHLISNETLSHWLRDMIAYELVEHAPVPLVLTASDLVSAEPVYLRRGDVVQAVLASSAAPGLLPPVRIADRWLVDGWILANAPIAWTARQGFDTIYVLPCGGTQDYRATAKSSAITRLLGPSSRARVQTLIDRGLPGGGAAIHQELVGALVARNIREEFQKWSSRVDIYLPPAPDVTGLSMFEFAEAPGLIEKAHGYASAWLPSARPLTADDLARPRALAGVND
jgi:NTE family protein